MKHLAIGLLLVLVGIPSFFFSVNIALGETIQYSFIVWIKVFLLVLSMFVVMSGASLVLYCLEDE